MLRSYLSSAIRNALKYKSNTLLNLLGLVLGMLGCLLILQYIRFERSYNDFHEKGDQIFRISYSKENNGVESFHTVLTYSGVGPLMKAQLPEVKDFTRLRPVSVANSRTLIRYGDHSFEEENVYYADASFFEIFSFPLLKGDPTTVLEEQFSVVITESMAHKYFGKEDPIGKRLIRARGQEFLVTGVMKDTPPNSHLQIHMLLSHITLSATQPDGWSENDLGVFHGHLYVETLPGTSLESFRTKFPEFVAEHIWLDEQQERQPNVVLKLWAMPLKDIHLHSHLEHEAERNGDADVVDYLELIALLILVIALVNYVNLSTARAMQRAKEVGIRKVSGALRSQLIGQFLLEAALVNGIAIVVSIGLVLAAQPIFELVGSSKLKEVEFLSTFWFWGTCLAIWGISTFLAGIYPALVLSGFEPIHVLKGGFIRQGKGALLRKVLVIFQFAASIALIITTGTVYQQLSFMRNQKLGINIDQTLVVKAPLIPDSTYQARFSGFRQELLALPEIQSFSASANVPGEQFSGATWFLRKDLPDLANQFCFINTIDEHFLEDYEVQLLAGRNFEAGREANGNSIMINRAAMEQLEFADAQDAIGKLLRYAGGSPESPDLPIIGVIDNYHQQSLKEEIDAIIIRYHPASRRYYSLKLSLPQASISLMNQIIDKIQAAWERQFPGLPFSYFFLEESFDQQYQAEIEFGRLIGLFSMMAILIGCLGLLGLATYTTRLRTKEIGIRKILGSSISHIAWLLVREFLQLFAIASILAWGLCWWGLQAWLESFAFRIGLNVGWFVLGACLVAVIAISTIAFHVLRAAYANPSDALRYE